MIRFFVKLLFVLAIVGTLYYFLPENIKEDIRAEVGRIVPSIKEKIDGATATPVRQRAETITELRATLSAIYELAASTTPPAAALAAAIQRSQTLVNELERLNEEESLTEKLKTEAAEKILGADRLPVCVPATATTSPILIE